jgi:hypothetical protein
MRDTYDSDGYERQIRETRSVKSKNNKKGFSTRIDQSINQQSISVRTIVKGCNRDREEGKVDGYAWMGSMSRYYSDTNEPLQRDNVQCVL